MAKQYKGSLTLEWYNKQKAIIQLDEKNGIRAKTDIPAPAVNWINKEDALFFEIAAKKGMGFTPFWVERNDIRIKEARPLVFQKAYKAIPAASGGWTVQEVSREAEVTEVRNLLIKGDNLLALNTLKNHFEKRSDDSKIKCIYIDPPYNTQNAFENYEDNLESSTWLTMIRDRLVKLRELLSSDGIMYIQLDEKFIFYIKVLMDDIFGKHNFLNFFTIKTSDPSGFKTVNPSPYDGAEYILMYAKNKSSYTYKTIYVESEYDKGYNQYIKNIDEGHEKWEFININQFVAEKEGFTDTREAKKALGPVVFESRVSEFAIANAGAVFQKTAIGDDAGAEMVTLREESKSRPDEFRQVVREDGIEYAHNGRQVYFYANKIKELGGVKTPTKQLTNIWTDIPYNGISGEGNVNFAESKKPERLIRRLLEIANVGKGDYVLDSFSGSGTTVAVAHKMGANWIGIEIGDHMDSHIIPRLSDVISGNDAKGVTNDLNFEGGGEFKYYHIGQSIINVDQETGKGEFNWSLGKKFIQDSLLVSYDYTLQTDYAALLPPQLFQEKGDSPSIGQIKGSNGRVMVGVAYLADPTGGQLTVTEEEIKALYRELKKRDGFQGLIVFTNKGIDLAQDAIPEDMDVIKVPNAVFTDLEK